MNKKLKNQIERHYMTEEQELRYWPKKQPKQKKQGVIIGNEPFESMHPPLEKDARLDDTELQGALKQMRARKNERDSFYEQVSKELSKEQMTELLRLIDSGFDALTADIWTKDESRYIKEKEEELNRIEKLQKDLPKWEINYKPNPLYEMYRNKIAKIKVTGQGRRPEIFTTQFIKGLHQFLSPIFDQPIKCPEEKFKGRYFKNSIEYIQDIFEAFFGEYRDRDAIRKAISKK